VKQGTSTSFVNFSGVKIGANAEDFLDNTKSFLNIFNSHGVSQDRININLDDEIVCNWGDKSFTSTILSFSIDDLEVGESNYMHAHPPAGNTQIPILEIGIGQERLAWKLGKTEFYMPCFDSVFKEYCKKSDPNHITPTIDCIRTSVLIVSAGVKPAHNNHGYR